MRIINLRDFPNIKDAIYCGRAIPGRPGSILGNPCSKPNTKCPVCTKVHFGTNMVPLTPDRSIPCYRRYLWYEINERKNEALIAAIKAIKEDDILACWCTNKEDEDTIFITSERCHTQVIWKAWRYLKEKEQA